MPVTVGMSCIVVGGILIIGITRMMTLDSTKAPSESEVLALTKLHARRQMKYRTALCLKRPLRALLFLTPLLRRQVLSPLLQQASEGYFIGAVAATSSAHLNQFRNRATPSHRALGQRFSLPKNS